MQAIELFSPAPEGSPANERTPASAPRKSHGAEQFQAVMGRALARSSRGDADNSDSSEELRRDRKFNAPRKSDSSSSTIANAAGCAQPQSPAPIAVKDTPVESAKDQAGTLEELKPAESAQPGAGVALPAPVAGDLAESLTASELIGPGQSAGEPKSQETVSANGQSTGGNPVVETATEAQVRSAPAEFAADEDPGGISGAKYPLPMQKADKANNFSGSTEKKLPDTGEPVPVRTRSGASLYQQSEIVGATPSSVSGPASSGENSSISEIAAQWPSPVRSLERAHDLMSLHAFRLRDSGADSLRVVIKPGLGLELSLNLQMRDGAVEMQALLQRGNYEFLNLHWPELQQQLEARGVRLASLACSDQLTNGDSSHSQQPRQEAEHPGKAGAFAEFALNGTLVPKPAAKTRTPVPRGWESWA
jgi:hypothetical protein